MYSAETKRLFLHLSQVRKYQFDNQYLFFDDVLNEIRILNPVAMHVMEGVNNGLNESQIADEIHRRFEVDLEIARADVRAFLHQAGTQPGVAVEEVACYVPTTDFVAHREPLDPVEGHYYLPGFQITITSELNALHSLLAEMFLLPAAGDTVCENLRLTVFADGDRYPIVHEGRTLDTGFTEKDTALKCLREINGLIAQSQQLCATIHAAAVALANKGVLMPAIGGSGKSTLAAYLMHQGFEFLNDDAVPLLLEPRELMPVPVALSIKSGSWPVLESVFPKLSELPVFGSGDRQLKYLAPISRHVRTTSVPCRLLVFPRYQFTKEKHELNEVSKTSAFELMMCAGCTFGPAGNHDTMQSLLDWLRDIPCYELIYSSLPDAERAIVSLLSDGDGWATTS